MPSKFIPIWSDEAGNKFFFPDPSDVLDTKSQALSYQANSTKMYDRLYGIAPSGVKELVADEENPQNLEVLGVGMSFGPEGMVVTVAGPYFEQFKPTIH
jgi:hypothetical protein